MMDRFWVLEPMDAEHILHVAYHDGARDRLFHFDTKEERMLREIIGGCAMQRLTYLLVLLLVLTMTAATGAGAPEEIATVREQFIDAWNAGNVEAIGALFADDAQFFTSFSPFLIEGKQAIKAFYTGFFPAFPTRRLVVRQPSVRLYGDTTAVDNGYFQAMLVDAKDQSRTTFGRYSTLYVKQGGKWVTTTIHASVLPVSP